MELGMAINLSVTSLLALFLRKGVAKAEKA